MAKLNIDKNLKPSDEHLCMHRKSHDTILKIHAAVPCKICVYCVDGCLALVINIHDKITIDLTNVGDYTWTYDICGPDETCMKRQQLLGAHSIQIGN